MFISVSRDTADSLSVLKCKCETSGAYIKKKSKYNMYIRKEQEMEYYLCGDINPSNVGMSCAVFMQSTSSSYCSPTQDGVPALLSLQRFV